MRRRSAVGALAVLLLGAGCGSPAPAAPGCLPECSGRACGDDGCGGSCGGCSLGASCSALGACLAATCTPACAGRTCGDDGCGGSCGACAEGASCSPAGRCEAAASLNCPGLQRCWVLEYTAWQYACTDVADLGPVCQPEGQIGVYLTFEDCRTAGCEGGNSTCGDQFGGTDPALAAACHACIATCTPSAGSPCPREVPGGCDYGGLLAWCTCR